VTTAEELESFAAAVAGATDTFRRDPHETHNDHARLLEEVKQ